ncbi:MAG: metallopeptidase family protein [Planctomycetota bacterium]
MSIDASHRARFDGLLERVIAALPERVAAVLEEVPVHVLDEPDERILADLGVPREHWEDERDSLCGLQTGHMLTERSIEDPADLGTQIHLFRRGIAQVAGGWEADDATLRAEIQITLLHELGHHFGLDEEDLDQLGYA